MQYIDGRTNIKILEETIVILGNFDGIHIGHQKLFDMAKKIGKNKKLKTTIFSFYPHPSWVLGTNPKLLLMSKKEKKQKIQDLGIDIYIEYPFTKAFSNMTAEKFITEIFFKKLNGKAVVIGENYFFGKNKEGTVTYMYELAEKYNFQVFVANKITKDNITVSSTYIRTLISDGKINEASQLLGHSYSVEGIITKGKQLGRTLGFPTINIIPDNMKVLPPKGVYIAKVKLLGKEYDGIANIGFNPTVYGKIKKIETFIFDFHETVYGEDASIEFVKYIRPEIKFDSIDELKNQLNKDKAFTLEYLTIDLQKKIDMI